MEAEDSIHKQLDIENGVLLTKKKSKKKRNIYLLILKAVVMFLCFIGFFFNSFMIFKQFIGNETVTSYKIQESRELLLPSLTLCGHSGFKRIVNSFDQLTPEYYVNNTIDVNEIFIEVIDNGNNSIKAPISLDMILRGPIYDKSKTLKIKATYSAYRGRCYTIEYTKKVYDRYITYEILFIHIIIN